MSVSSLVVLQGLVVGLDALHNHQLIPLQIQSMLWCALIDPRDGQRWIEKLEKVATLV